jgi:tRNA threonylcarbamoyladenosine biosynthesis protein TsaE
MLNKRTFISKSADETARFAKEYVENLLKRGDNCGKLATVIALEGDLGSGKTTFVKAAAKALGVQKTVTSPTFVLEKVYKIKQNGGFTHLIHIDAYRLENGAELLALGWKALIEDPRNIIFIEWPERVGEVLSRNIKTIKFRFIDETTRRLKIN